MENGIVLKKLNKSNQNEIEKAVQKLKENEKLLLEFDNSLSMKHFCQVDVRDNLFCKREIEELLDKLGLVYRKFYYPLPDCEDTNVIFTDKHLPDAETLSRNIVFYAENDIKVYEQNQEFEKLLVQDPKLFPIFANSFIVECSKWQFEPNPAEFISYSNMRKEEYRIKTVIAGDKVYKTAASEKSKKHIDQIKKNIDLLNQLGLETLDSYEEDKIISRYQKGKQTLDKQILQLLKENKEEKANQIIDHLVELLKEKLVVLENSENNVFDKYQISYQKEEIAKMTFVKYGLWDLVFPNIFYIEDKYYFYDQEWFDENLPLEYIIYRSFYYNSKLKELMVNRFSIDSLEVELFKKLDDKIQEKIRSGENWKRHTYTSDVWTQIYKSKEQIQNITEDCKKLLLEKDSRIKFLEDNMEQTCNILRETENELNNMKNSLSWKVTKPLRGVRKILK
ncbi:MAG: hypothetical protein IJ629_05900 [Clostridia bacterium]|nr:hypothetical protein [Clostridia bacterium]